MITDNWSTVSRKLFGERSVSLKHWREGISAGHSAYLPNSVAALSSEEFIRFYGPSEFKSDWPKIRSLLSAETLIFSSMFDLAWSQLVGGGCHLAPALDYYKLPEKRRLFLTTVANSPGESIYAVAKKLGMQYRRAHDHAAWLTDAGKIHAVEVTENGHKKKKLFPTNIAHHGVPQD